MLIPTRHLRRLVRWSAVRWFSLLLLLINVLDAAGDLWPMDRPDGMPSIQSLEVMCGKDHMDVHLTFSQPFEGIVSSKGQHGDPRCVYVPPSTGETFFSFRIAYARCGTKPDLHGQFYENTVVVQYDKDLLEVWDEAKRLRCEWFNDYEKTASKPPMVIADLDVIQLDFRGDNVDCWMEIQHGKGPWAPPVTGIVPLGSTLTLVVAINDYRGEFDMRVKSCVASDGGGHVIQLSDEFGCVLRPKMISRFLKARGADERASVITYAFFHAFKFPDALSVHIKCKVEICRHGCLDHCQLQPEKGDVDTDLYLNPLERKDDDASKHRETNNNLNHPHPDSLENERPIGDLLYDDLMQEPIVKMPLSSHFDQQQQQQHQQQQDQQEKNSGVKEAPISSEQENAGGEEEDDDDTGDQHEPQRPQQQQQQYQQQQQQQEHPTLDSLFASSTTVDKEELDITALPHKDMFMMSHEQFPHGPRTFEEDLLMRSPVAAPRVFTDDSPTVPTSTKSTTTSTSPTKKRRRRSITVSDRRARSADVGVSGLYEVISEADLAFSPGDARAEGPVTVFQGRIREEVVYGICMPVPGFSVLFVLVAVSAVVSALVAGTLLYRYQLQKEHLAAQARNGPIPLGIFAGGWRMLRARAAGFGAAAARMNGAATSTAAASVTPSGANNVNGKTDSLCHCE